MHKALHKNKARFYPNILNNKKPKRQNMRIIKKCEMFVFVKHLKCWCVPILIGRRKKTQNINKLPILIFFFSFLSNPSHNLYYERLINSSVWTDKKNRTNRICFPKKHSFLLSFKSLLKSGEICNYRRQHTHTDRQMLLKYCLICFSFFDLMSSIKDSCIENKNKSTGRVLSQKTKRPSNQTFWKVCPSSRFL